MHQRGLAQIDRRVAGLVEHTRQRQHAAAGNRAAAPGQVSRHRGIACNVQRAARKVDARRAVRHVQVGCARIDVQCGQAEVGIDVGDIVRDAQRRRRQRDGRVEIHRAAAWCQHREGKTAGIEARCAAALIEIGNRTATIRNELAGRVADRYPVQVQRAERFEAAAVEGQRAADARCAIDGQAAAADRQRFFGRERTDRPCAGADRDGRRDAHTVDQDSLRRGIRRGTQ